MSRVYWDSMLLIYWIEEHPAYSGRVQHILGRMEERNDTLCTSSFALGEILVSPYKKGAYEVVKQMRDAIRPPFAELLPFTDDVADHYGRIRATLGVSSADAIHLACAAQAKVDLFLTNDRKLVGKIVPGIQFIASLESEIL